MFKTLKPILLHLRYHNAHHPCQSQRGRISLTSLYFLTNVRKRWIKSNPPKHFTPKNYKDINTHNRRTLILCNVWVCDWLQLKNGSESNLINMEPCNSLSLAGASYWWNKRQPPRQQLVCNWQWIQTTETSRQEQGCLCCLFDPGTLEMNNIKFLPSLNKPELYNEQMNSISSATEKKLF